MNGRRMGRSCAVGALVIAAACGGESAPARPKVTQLSPPGVRHLVPSYSPDGKRLVWWSPSTDSAGGWQLWMANADMSAPAQLPVRGRNVNPAIWSPDGTRIAATSGEFGFADVVVLPVAGGPVQRVTRGTGVEFPQFWYPDGDRLVYTASAAGATFTSFVVSLKTGVSVPLTPTEKRPTFGGPSRDGSHIAYVQIDGAKATVWVADGNGANPRQLTTEGFENINNFAWSPDGKELLYESRRTGTSDLWVAPIDGGKPRQLTRDVRNDYNGTWSPDGKWIAFVSDRGRQTDIWLVPSAGGAEQRVTDTAIEEQGTPIWRPGTSELSFVTNIQNSGVWAHELADGKERRLTPDSIRPNVPRISPDGKQVLFTIERGGGIQDLAVVPLAGGAWRTLVAGGGTVDGPLWSPDGSKIVFTSDRGGTQDVWLEELAGGAPRQVVNWPGFDNSPVFSGDGSMIFFQSDRESKLDDAWKVPVAGGEPVRVTHDGSLNGIFSRAGVPDIYASTISSRGGELAILRILKDGRLQPVWDKSNSYLTTISPKGDSTTAMVERADGKMASMILPAGGGAGRVILPPNYSVVDWSNDGKWMLYQFDAAGETDLGLLEVATGTMRRLTTTPEAEYEGTFTPDGKTIAFRRRVRLQTIWTTDLAKLLTPGR